MPLPDAGAGGQSLPSAAAGEVPPPSAAASGQSLPSAASSDPPVRVGKYGLLWAAPLDQVQEQLKKRCKEEGMEEAAIQQCIAGKVAQVAGLWYRQRRMLSYTKREEALRHYARLLADGHPRHLVWVGFGHASGGVGGSISVRGGRFPLKRFKERVLPRYATIVITLEHFTSQMCSLCTSRFLHHHLHIQPPLDWPPQGKCAVHPPWPSGDPLPPPERMSRMRHQRAGVRRAKGGGEGEGPLVPEGDPHPTLGRSWRTKVGMRCVEPSCGVVLSRDTNSARNMLLLLHCILHAGGFYLRPAPLAFYPKKKKKERRLR